MASGPITSWQYMGEIMEPVRYFILGVSKITADGDCSHEIKRFQTHVCRVGDAIQPPHPLLSPSLIAFSLSQHQGLFQ